MIEYRDIPDYPGYRVGNNGSVWSCWIKGNAYYPIRLGTTWKYLKPVDGKKKYLQVTLVVNGETSVRGLCKKCYSKERKNAANKPTSESRKCNPK